MINSNKECIEYLTEIKKVLEHVKAPKEMYEAIDFANNRLLYDKHGCLKDDGTGFDPFGEFCGECSHTENDNCPMRNLMSKDRILAEIDAANSKINYLLRSLSYHLKMTTTEFHNSSTLKMLIQALSQYVTALKLALLGDQR